VKVNGVRVGLGIILSIYWIYAILAVPVWDDTQKIVWTLLFCFSLLLIGLAFERKE